MKEHAVWELFFQITYFESQLRRKVFAINFKNCRPAVVVTPNLDFLDQEMKLGASLEMQTFILLDWPNG